MSASIPGTLSAVMVVSLLGSPAFATDSPNGRGVYLGVFGGGGTSTSASVQQSGAVLSNPPTPVNARGTAGGTGVGMGGAHLGYEWGDLNFGDSDWALKPAAEIEGYYLGSNLSAELNSPYTPRVPNHWFSDTLPQKAGVFLANTVLALKTPYSDKLFPYIGGGVGGAILSINGATSEQISPPERGLNHFNSNPNASSSAFAATAKAGLRGEIYERLSLFVEYRYLFVDSSSYDFGSTHGAGTPFPNHLPTTPWGVNLGSQNYNMGVAGFEFSF